MAKGKFPMLIRVNGQLQLIKRSRQIPECSTVQIIATQFDKLSQYEQLAKIVTNGEAQSGMDHQDVLNKVLKG
jgi:hypothetical protein